jgi:predicted MFS family arabinose efflux permease
MMGVLLLCNRAVQNAAGLAATASFFGLFSVMFVATSVLLLVALTRISKRKFGTRMGMAFSMMDLGAPSGGPGSGVVLQMHADRMDWKGTCAYGGAFTVAAGLALYALGLRLGCWNLGVKV